MQVSNLKGNQLLNGLLISVLLHLLALLYAQSGLHAWISRGTGVATLSPSSVAKEVSCCVQVRLELPLSPAAPLPVSPSLMEGREAAPVPRTPAPSASSTIADKTKSETAAVAEAHASSTPLLEGQPLAEAVYFFDKSELNVFPVLETPLEFDIASLPIDDVALGYADIVIYIQADGQVVQLETELSSLSEPTLRLVAQTLLKAVFTPGRVSGDPVPAKIHWRIVVESASSFTMMNSR